MKGLSPLEVRPGRRRYVSCTPLDHAHSVRGELTPTFLGVVPPCAELRGWLHVPDVMVTAMRSLLNGAGVDDDDIRTEEFTGY